jgi:hypothetical protein
VKTKLALIVYLHNPKNAQTICFCFLYFETEIILILFSPFLPLPNKTQTLDPWVLAPSSGQTVRSNVCERISLKEQNLLCVVPDARVNVKDVVSDEPDEVGEVGDGGLVDDELEHGLLFDAVHV